MGTMLDAVNAPAIPAGTEVVAGYIDCGFVWSHSDWARFPDAVKVRITVDPSTNDGDVIDIEPGNWSPEDAPGWVAMRRKAGHPNPGVYTMGSWWQACRDAFAAQGVAEPVWWIADWDGDPHVEGDAVAKQYANGDMLGVGYDTSVTVDGWPAGAPAAPAATPAVPPASGDTYLVRSGDTLSGIGARLGVDWHDIAACNGITAPFTIYPGQVLNLPAGHAPARAAGRAATYTVRGGDTLSGIGARLGVPWRHIASANGITAPFTIYPGQVLTIPGKNGVGGGGHGTYTVQAGDTLSGIGAQLGVDWRHLADLNGITDPNLIYPGETIHY